MIKLKFENNNILFQKSLEEIGKMEVSSLYMSNQERKDFCFLPLHTRNVPEDTKNSNFIYINEEFVQNADFNSKIYFGVFRHKGVCVKNIPGVCQKKDAVFKDIESVLRVGQHKNVLTHLYGTLLDHQLWLVTERWESNLKQCIKEHKISSQDRVTLSRQCAEGLQYLHEKEMVHGNLKPSNILVDPTLSVVKLSDFGMPHIHTEFLQNYLESGVTIGIVDWMAPELLECIRNEIYWLKQDYKSDVFSLGCIFFYIASNGLHPFGKILERLDNMMNDNPIYPGENINLQTLPLISWMISFEAQTRPSTTEVLAHPLFWSAEKSLEFITSVSDLLLENPEAQGLVKEVDDRLLHTHISEWKNSLNYNVHRYLLSHQGVEYTTTLKDVLSCFSHLIINFTKLTDEYKEIFGNSLENLHMYITSHFPVLIPFLWINLQKFRNSEKMKHYYIKNQNSIPVPKYLLSMFSEKKHSEMYQDETNLSDLDFFDQVKQDQTYFFPDNIKGGFLNINDKILHNTLNEMTYLEDIGNGEYGHVVKVLHSPSKQIFAVKKIKLALIQSHSKLLENDLKVMVESSECNSIVTCLGYFISDTDIWVCMEMMTISMAKLIKSSSCPIPEEIIGKVAVAIVTALNYLQVKHNIHHGNVKPSNILVDQYGNFKLSDLGVFGRPANSITSIGANSDSLVSRLSPYGIKEDVWSVGITLLEVSSGKHPYRDSPSGFFEIMSKVLDNEGPLLKRESYTESFISFIQLCLTYSFLMRSDYNMLLNHEFIKVSTVNAVNSEAWLQDVLRQRKKLKLSDREESFYTEM